MSGPSGLISELIQSSVGAERICMDISDVKELLNKGEKVDVECKESDSKLSKSIWDARKLAALISEDLKISIKSANKSANSDKKSANKSADSDKKSANSMSKLTERQKQILAIMEDGGEYTTETIARAIGLKGPRTRQILNELVELGEIVSLGTTKDRRYRIENA